MSTAYRGRTRKTAAARRADADAIAIDAVRRVVIYVRISKNRETQDSTENQLERMRSYCQNRGWIIVREYEDVGQSAFAGKAPRPEFDKALKLIKTGAANTLMVYKLNRFMRDAADALNVRDQIHEWGGCIVSESESVDTADRTNLATSLMFYMLSQMAEMESAAKSDVIQDWHDRRNAKGMPPAGRLPYGYKRVPDRTEDGRPFNNLAIVDDEAQVIRELAQAVIRGESLASLVRTFHRPITQRGLKYLLTSDTVAGLRETDGRKIEGVWPAILDRSTFDQVCAMLNDPNRRTNYTDGQPAWMLAGIIMCESCQLPMRSKTHPKGKRYACRKCGQSIRTDHADDAVADWITSNVDQAAWQKLRESGRGYDPAVVETIEQEMTQIARLHADQVIGLDQFLIMQDGLKRRLAAAVNSDPVELPDVDDLAASWVELDVAAKRLVVAATCERITVAPWVSGTEPRERITVD